MLASVVNFFNPSLIVIGGGVAKSGTSCSPRSARRSTGDRCRSRRGTSLIQRSSLGGLGGVIGASAMVVDQLFSRDAIGAWIEAGDPSGVPEVALAGSA